MSKKKSLVQLPGTTVYMDVTTVEQAWAAIRDMNVSIPVTQHFNFKEDISR